MLLVLQIVFIILSALCAGAVLVVGALLGWGYAGFCILLTLLFLGLSLLCKQSIAIRKAKEEAKTDEDNSPNA